MSTTILIPTDFSIPSLTALRRALELSPQPVHVRLLYAELLSDSITDLLFYSGARIIDANMTPYFAEAIEIIRNRFEKQITSFDFILFHGSTLSAMNDLLKANKVNDVFISTIFPLNVSKRSFDPVPLLKKADVRLHEVTWSKQLPTDSKAQLQTLFNWNHN